MHGCTITTSHYLAHARAMAESYLAHHPGAQFTVLMIDDWSGPRPQRESFQTLTLADVGIDEQELNRRATMYITQGLANSLKADLMLAVLAAGDQQVLYLDSDAYVYADLSHLGDLAERHSLVLSPHSYDPYPLWEVDSPEQMFMRAGVMNAGLIGVGQGARPFLEWWAQRTARRCVFDLPRALLVDQTWLMLAPALFDHHILRDRGCNVAGWNLHTRDVQWEGDVPTIDGGPLRHFHFAMSYDPEHPERLTASEQAYWWPTLDRRPGVARLSREYAECLLSHGYREVRHAPPLFDAMPGGAPIEPWMRASYRTALIHAEATGEPEPPNPFSDGEDRFTAWIESRTLKRLDDVSVASDQAAAAGFGGSTDARLEQDEPFSAQEMARAMMDTEKTLGRIRELESIRDEAVAWAERASGDLEQAKGVIAERDKLIAEQGAALQARLAQLDEVWQSPSWRLTQPLRTAKGLITRAR